MTTNHVFTRLTVAARILLIVAIVFTSYEATIKTPVSVSVDNSDKFMHALAFFSLALLSDFAFPVKGFGVTKIALLVSYGALIEFVQSFLPWRSADVFDLLADCFGVAAYAGFIPLLKLVPMLRERWQF